MIRFSAHQHGGVYAFTDAGKNNGNGNVMRRYLARNLLKVTSTNASFWQFLDLLMLNTVISSHTDLVVLELLPSSTFHRLCELKRVPWCQRGELDHFSIEVHSPASLETGTMIGNFNWLRIIVHMFACLPVFLSILDSMCKVGCSFGPSCIS